MSGNELVRFCGHCALSVHNLSEMTADDASRLVAASRGRLCVRYFRRADGKILTTLTPETRLPAKLHQIKRRASRIAAGAFSAALGLTTSAFAQTPAPQSLNVNVDAVTQTQDTAAPVANGGRAAVKGTVTDPTGAVIPGAIVTLVNEATNTKQATSSDAEGRYGFPSVEAGAYTLKIEASGFAANETQQITLKADEEQRMDRMLAVGGEWLSGVVVVTLPPNDPLVKAAYADDIAAVREALSAGSNVNVIDEITGTTALDEAASRGNLEIVQLLVGAGANVNTRNQSGQTPLMLSFGERASVEMVRAFVTAGARVNLKDEQGESALTYAARQNKPDVIQALIDAGARVNSKTKEGRTALMIATKEGHVDAVRTLLMAGADVNRKDKEGSTALDLAEEEEEGDNAALRKLLVAYGAVEK